MAAILGADSSSDEFFVAFILPDFLNYLLAGAFLSITFIPIFLRHTAAGREEEAWAAFTAIIRPMAFAMTGLVLVGMVAAPYMITWLEPGFDAAQVAHATRLTRIVLPAQVFFVTGSLLMAVQYAREQFVVPTLAPIIYNLGIITGGVVFGHYLDMGVDGFAWGVLGGAIVGNFVVQIWGARRAGMHLTRGVTLRHPAIKEYFLLAVPLMLGQSVVVLDEQLGRSFGSEAGPGAISWLNYARRLMLVPGGVIAQAAGVAAYPYLARMAEEGKLEQLKKTLADAMRYVIFLSLPAAAVLIVLAEPAIQLAFERGAYRRADTVATAAALMMYAFAVPVWGVVQVITRGFYARRQMWTPVLIGTCGTIVAIPLYKVLLDLMGFQGLALASTIVLTAYTCVLVIVWFARTGWEPAREVALSSIRALVCAATAGAAAFFGLRALGLGGLGTFGHALLTSVVGVTAIGVVFLGLATLLRAPEVTVVAQRVLKRIRR